MRRRKRPSDWLLLPAFLAPLGLAGGCTEKLVGFEPSFSSMAYVTRGGAPNGDTIALELPKRHFSPSPDPVYVRPHDAILKMNGYLPVRPLKVTESGDSFLVEFRLPEDLVQRTRTVTVGEPRFSGELILPLETGVTSFAGVEHYIPSAAFLSGDVTGVYSGPLNRAARSIGDFLRGLYAAR